jgi:hypothetical protein
MAEVDTFSQTLFEEAKRFYEKALDESDTRGEIAYLHAALNLGFCALEAHVNAIADDFLTRSDLSILDRSILQERDFKLENGEYKLTEQLKMYRPEDRIQFIHRRFSGKQLDKNSGWWSDLKAGSRLRNELTHPKQASEISKEKVERSLQAIIDTFEATYKAVYHTSYPVGKRGLTSRLTF